MELAYLRTSGNDTHEDILTPSTPAPEAFTSETSTKACSPFDSAGLYDFMPSRLGLREDRPRRKYESERDLNQQHEHPSAPRSGPIFLLIILLRTESILMVVELPMVLFAFSLAGVGASIRHWSGAHDIFDDADARTQPLEM
ncbi:hypothetical protein T440DRAFT_110427 [Plenodomus tracheiphilus IPT5]|uniref:Uncharacterized protein n=1 Tax=Plenodomus tracheiphilus IPT5 TaxID=1408161 RepID=A0A6A7B4F3_9PLEO|nr:hypothetical protein T440DRAFT_110427 [Plenodomus tracheiphilus IPT5]